MPYLIWDFDGTLGGREGKWTGALVETWEQTFGKGTIEHDQLRPHLQAGFPWHNPETLRQKNMPADKWWELLYPVFEQAYCKGGGIELSSAKELARRARSVFLTPQRWQLFDDTLPSLEYLSAKGWRHIVLSNHVPELEMILRELRINHFFERVFNSAATGVEKPHPQAFANVLEALPEEERKIMIGDNIRADIHGARNAGLEGILVRGEHPEAERCCADLRRLAAMLG